MPAPERIGRYRVLGELGRGAMGTVYRCHDDDLDRDVAIKVMGKRSSDEGSRTRFLREARAAARLQHPNIVVIYELGEQEDCLFMVLELLEGMDLQHAIEQGLRPDPRLILPLTIQVLAGLAHAHDHGIVHRDLKPSNVFLPVGQPAKIMDFGVARLAGAGITTSGALSGTPSYMSPEQVSGGEVDGRSDLFSVGLMLYELLTGEKAIQADTVASVLYKVVHETPDLALLPGTPEWRRLRGVLERTLARRREDRYPDARSLSADLGLALADLGGAATDWVAPSERLLLHRTTRAASAPAPAREAPPRPRPSAIEAAPASGARRRVWPFAVASSLLAVLVGAGIGLIARHRVPAPPVSVEAPSVSAAMPASPAASAAGAPATTAPAAEASPSSSPAATPSSTVAAAPSPSPLATPSASPSLPTDARDEAPAPVSAAAPAAGGIEARLGRTRELLKRSRWAEALAEARAVLEVAPTNAEASALAQQAQAEIVIEECLRNARSALREGDRDRALAEVRRGFLVRKNDPRLLEMHREVVQQ